MTERLGFYERVLRRLLEQGLVRREWRVLVVAGGDLDRRAFAATGFTDVTVTNLSGDADEVQDAEQLTYEDDTFDFAVISAGLHHCASPHRALLELYRVARRGVLALEARDSALMRIAQRAGVVDEFELTAVADNEFASGGVRNSAVPNYVYRWTEREVEKTIASAHPQRRHRFVFFRELELPGSVLDLGGKSRWRLAEAPLRLVTKAFPKQANLFAFAVFREGLQPWMSDDDTLDVAEVERRLGRHPSSP
ncbi:MAG TPA: methyltransferase domain-containing protein [Gaiellaceae bacterium]|nr:methyltransferase domain-containing protein [Gaiellaceae bacterium]